MNWDDPQHPANTANQEALPYYKTGERLDNGVRARMDGKGDPWAKAHRDELGGGFNMSDIDVAFGIEAFGMNTGDRLFLEYATDTAETIEDAVRRFGYVALFERKISETAAMASRGRHGCALYMDLCRKLSRTQPVSVRFFYVFGGNMPPWTMKEVDVKTGEIVGKPITIETGSWKQLWSAIGLSRARAEVTKWVRTAAPLPEGHRYEGPSGIR